MISYLSDLKCTIAKNNILHLLVIVVAYATNIFLIIFNFGSNICPFTFDVVISCK